MRVFRIDDPIYHNEIFLVVDTNQEELHKHLCKKYPNFTDKDKKEIELTGITTGEYFTVDNKNLGISHRYVVLQKFNWTIDQQALLVHELDHARDAMLQDAGVDIKDNEARAYFLQYLFREVLIKLRPFHPNIKRKKKLAK